MDRARPVRFRFDNFEADLVTGELYENGERVLIQGKPFQFLAVLLESGGNVVTREAISRRLWPDTHVQVDQGLNAAARKVRLALHDNAANPKYIETLGSRGYRFIYPIQTVRGNDAPAPDSVRIAVLPIQNLAGVDDIVASGITSELSSQLGRMHPNLAVIAPDSMETYKGSNKSLADIQRELATHYFVTSTLGKNGHLLRLSIMLVHATDEHCLWAETYDRPPEQLFAIQSEIAAKIARSLQHRLKSSIAAPQSRATQFSVYESYLRGRHFWNKRTRPDLQKSIKYFQQALAHDPDYALAHAGLADAYNMLASHGLVLPRDGFARAKRAAERAIEIEPDLPEGLVALAWSQMSLEHEWSVAREHFEHAITLNPSNSFAYSGYAFLLLALDTPDKATQAMRRARDIDPLSLPTNAVLGHCYFYARDFEAAIEQAQSSIELDPQFPVSYVCLGQACLQLKRIPEALTAFEQAVRFSQQAPIMMAFLAHAQAVAGDIKRAQQAVAELSRPAESRVPPAYQIALVHLALGDNENAFEWLQRAVEGRFHCSLFLGLDPRLDALRNDERFAAIYETSKLPAKT